MPEKLKHTFFTRASLEELAAAVRAVYPAFLTKRFLKLVHSEQWSGLDRIGGKMSFASLLQTPGERACKIRLEYALHFMKKGGKLSRKVFQISEKRYPPGEHVITKSHSFVDRSTRKHHAGEHRLEVIVNGVSKAGRTFRLGAD